MKVSIPEPCPADWNTMKVGLISRHCDQCEKNVIDFTKMDRSEIIIHLLSNPTEKTCGRMTRNQFDFHHDDIPLLIEGLKKKGGNVSFLILALVSISLVSCNEDNRKTSIKPINPIYQNHHRGGTIGEVSVQNDSIPNCSVNKTQSKGDRKKDKRISEPVLMGEPMIVGDIQLIEPPEILPPKIEDEVLSFAEKMPEFPGGINALFAHIKENLVYPTYEKENAIEGTVYVKFIVTEEGKVTNSDIVRGVTDAPNFSKEVLRIMKEMPTWIPGENKGKKVKVYFTLPFKFRLN